MHNTDTLHVFNNNTESAPSSVCRAFANTQNWSFTQCHPPLFTVNKSKKAQKSIIDQLYLSNLSLLLQIGRTHPSLAGRVGFGWFCPNQPSFWMNTIQDFNILTLFQNETVLISTVRRAVSPSNINVKCL